MVSLKATIQASFTAVVLGITSFGKTFLKTNTINMYVPTGVSSWYHLAIEHFLLTAPRGSQCGHISYDVRQILTFI